MSRLLLVFLVLAALLPAQARADSWRASTPEALPPSSPAQYGSLALLLGKVCAESASTFTGFFDPSPVRVRPFVHLGALKGDSSILGVMLADQMAAALNSHANASPSKEGGGQTIEGVIQEMDGYLRIHMLGTNRQRQRRSHVAVIEMSATLYRALHSQVDSW